MTPPEKELETRKTQAFKEQLCNSFREDDSDANRRKWARFIVENKDIDLKELIGLIHAERFIALRFIWMVGCICEIEPGVVYPSIPYFFSQRKEVRIPNFNSSLAKMFLLAGIPGGIEGEAIDEMFRWLLDASTNGSTKSRTLSALYNLTGKYDGLKNELKIVLEDQLNKNSSSFGKQAKKVLEKLEHQKTE